MTASRKSSATGSRDHEEATIASLRADPEFAAAYLDSVLEDGDQDEFLLALRRLSEACGGVQSVAARARLNPTDALQNAVRAREPRAQKCPGHCWRDGPATFD